MYHLYKRRINKNTVSILLLVFSLTVSVFFSDEISKFVKEGLCLCVNSIIGSVFPFIILTDIFFHFTEFESIGIFKKLFEKAFKINGAGIRAFLCGIVCGFPLGVKVAADLYRGGVISKGECERLIAFSNNTGPAFVISAVGAGIRRSLSDGLILYVSMVLSAVIVGIILGFGEKWTKNQSSIDIPPYSFVTSIRDGGLSTLSICSFITFFSVIVGLLASVVPSGIFILLLPFLEVGNASKILFASVSSHIFSLSLTSFAISFSGISVMAQAKSFLPPEISIKKYTLAKFMQGCISVLLTLLFVKIS